MCNHVASNIWVPCVRSSKGRLADRLVQRSHLNLAIDNRQVPERMSYEDLYNLRQRDVSEGSMRDGLYYFVCEYYSSLLEIYGLFTSPIKHCKLSFTLS